MSTVAPSTALYRLYGHLLVEADEVRTVSRRLGHAAAVLRWRGAGGAAARRRIEELAAAARTAASSVHAAADEVAQHAASVTALADRPVLPGAAQPR